MATVIVYRWARDAADALVAGDAESHPGIPVTVAGHLGRPAVVGAVRASIGAEGIEVIRRVGDSQETLSITPPVVIGARAEHAENRTPGMKEQLAARKRLASTLSVDDLDLPVLPPLEVQGSKPPQTRAAHVFSGDSAQAAAELVAALRAEEVL